MYIYYAMSINNPEFENYLCQMYHVTFEIKDTIVGIISASYLDLQLSIQREDFNCHTTKFSSMSSNIQSSPVYCVLSLSLYDTSILAPPLNVSF